MKMVLASKNPHKLVEIQKIVERFDIQLVLESELGVDIDVEETGTTFEENSLLKAKAVMEATGLPALADDSGIAVDALMTPEGQMIQARGEVHGELLRAPAGTGGFGYDPIFYYPPLGKTLAEVAPEEKNQVSHRARALKVLYEKMKEAGYADK